MTNAAQLLEPLDAVPAELRSAESYDLLEAREIVGFSASSHTPAIPQVADLGDGHPASSTDLLEELAR